MTDGPDVREGGEPPDLQRPSIARVYDYMLGGNHNFAVDREFAARMLERLPGVAGTFANNRAFLRRAVRYCVRAGVDQFLDLGSGIPTMGSVHEVARAIDPDTRVAYVDNEPVAVAHSEQILAGLDGVSISSADMRDPESVWSAPGVRDVLDLERPVAVLMVAVLHFAGPADDPRSILDGYRSRLVPGSLFAVSHATTDLRDPADRAAMEEGERLYRESSTPLHLRDRSQLADLLSALTLVDPGVVEMRDWHRDPEEPEARGVGEALAVVGRVD
ncbi:SAM-dependent methyltransferase [Pseudonocardia endophytica]|uniref:S-adenosyl methyltransferase n=1 Tax=Pseudonocardia endophytica TaxID=401976 RepID=A0A4R1HVW9_PSEEN|nr:SAM-dependent methyltransferase [Pseudonocardia endophytica]TCK25155.1 S-adenosyl methyltransferase [Pseudonocardia endophytica]